MIPTDFQRQPRKRTDASLGRPAVLPEQVASLSSPPESRQLRLYSSFFLLPFHAPPPGAPCHDLLGAPRRSGTGLAPWRRDSSGFVAYPVHSLTRHNTTRNWQVPRT